MATGILAVMDLESNCRSHWNQKIAGIIKIRFSDFLQGRDAEHQS